MLSKEVRRLGKYSTNIRSMRPVSSNAPGKSRLFPNTNTGMPVNCGLSNNECNSLRDASILSKSAASTIYLWNVKMDENLS